MQTAQVKHFFRSWSFSGGEQHSWKAVQETLAHSVNTDSLTTDQNNYIYMPLLHWENQDFKDQRF